MEAYSSPIKREEPPADETPGDLDRGDEDLESDALLPTGIVLHVSGLAPQHADYFFHATKHFPPPPSKPPCLSI